MITVLLASFGYFAWHQMSGLYYGLVAVIVLGVGSATLAARANRETQQAIAGKDSEIERLAKRAERERIARDLHDLLGHTLSLVAIKADLAGRFVAMGDERSVTEIEQIGRIARDALAQVREAIAGLRRVGLRDALRASRTMLEASGLETRVQDDPVPNLSDAQEIALAQAVLEASTNIVRHSGASRAAIGLLLDSDSVGVRIDDNGKGGCIEPGNGLRGMGERLRALGGKLEHQDLNPGLRLTATLPLKPQGAR
jgi:two-component system sensor histidine kinase DesK